MACYNCVQEYFLVVEGTLYSMHVSLVRQSLKNNYVSILISGYYFYSLVYYNWWGRGC